MAEAPTIQVDIVSAEGELFSGDAAEVTAVGARGAANERTAPNAVPAELEAMAHAGTVSQSFSAKPPVRFACLYFPNGAWMKNWIPATIGSDYELPSSLAPLAPVKDALAIASKLAKLRSSRLGAKEYDVIFFPTPNPETSIARSEAL